MDTRKVVEIISSKVSTNREYDGGLVFSEAFHNEFSCIVSLVTLFIHYFHEFQNTTFWASHKTADFFSSDWISIEVLDTYMFYKIQGCETLI